MKRINRRNFLKTSASIATGSLITSALLPKISSGFLRIGMPDITCVKGNDYFLNAQKALELLGGMSQFVKPGSKVALLISPHWDKPATFTSPDVALAIIDLCYKAGAGDIYCLASPGEDYWAKSARAGQMTEYIKALKPGSAPVEIEIPQGKYLKKAEIVPELLSADVFINIPIAKQHEGCNFTGLLKNMMGACPHTTNRFFHFGAGNNKGFYENVEFLSQCIADLNLVRKPDLCVIDATEVILTNGPAGPGEIMKPQRVLSGTDPVAMDAFAAHIIGKNPEDILKIKMAQDHGIGKMDYQSMIITEVVL